MNVYTNCNSCIFYDDDKEVCTQGMWEHPEFKERRAYDTENKEWHIIDRICPRHRTSGWRDLVGDDLDEALRNEIKVKFSIIQAIHTDEAFSKFLVNLDNLVQESDICSIQGIYIVDRRGDASDPAELSRQLKKYKRPYAVKKALTDDEDYVFVDQFMQTRKVKSPFYVFGAEPDSITTQMIGGLYNLIVRDLKQVLYAGDDDCYFMASMLHQIKKRGFADYLKTNDAAHTVFSSDEILNA